MPLTDRSSNGYAAGSRHDVFNAPKPILGFFLGRSPHVQIIR
jgi:hypothetical protein